MLVSQASLRARRHTARGTRIERRLVDRVDLAGGDPIRQLTFQAPGFVQHFADAADRARFIRQNRLALVDQLYHSSNMRLTSVQFGDLTPRHLGGDAREAGKE